MKELEEQTHPEILRSNLSNAVLGSMKLGIEVGFSWVRALFVTDPFF